MFQRVFCIHTDSLIGPRDPDTWQDGQSSLRILLLTDMSQSGGFCFEYSVNYQGEGTSSGRQPDQGRTGSETTGGTIEEAVEEEKAVCDDSVSKMDEGKILQSFHAIKFRSKRRKTNGRTRLDFCKLARKDIQAATCLPVGISSLSPFRSLSICISPVSHNAFLSFSRFSDKC